MSKQLEDGKWVKPEDIDLGDLRQGGMYLIDVGAGGGVPGEGELEVVQCVPNDDYNEDDEDGDDDQPPVIFESYDGDTYHPVDEVFALFPIPTGFSA